MSVSAKLALFYFEDLLRDATEQLLNPLASLRRRLEVLHIMLARVSLGLLLRNLPLPWRQVAFVAAEKHRQAFAGVIFDHLVDPVLRAAKALLFAHIKAYYGSLRIPVVERYHRPEPLGATSVPDV